MGDKKKHDITIKDYRDLMKRLKIVDCNKIEPNKLKKKIEHFLMKYQNIKSFDRHIQEIK